MFPFGNFPKKTIENFRVFLNKAIRFLKKGGKPLLSCHVTGQSAAFLLFQDLLIICSFDAYRSAFKSFMLLRILIDLQFFLAD